jgi:hypothetical protein
MSYRMVSRFIFLLAVSAAAAVSATAAAQAQTADPPVALDWVGAEASAPCIATAADGKIGCAWVSKRAGAQYVLFRERIGGLWTESVAFGGRPDHFPANPTLLYDEDANPHVVWRDGPELQGEIVYAYRHSGIWIEYGAISGETGADVDNPSAAIGAAGRLYVAWQQGSGTFSDIAVATLEPDGRIVRALMSQSGHERFNLYPAVIGGARPVVYWYAEGDFGLGLEAREFDPVSSHRTPPAALPDLSALPANRLPYLFGLDSDRVMAVWNVGVNGAERVFLGESGEGLQGRGGIVDDNGQGANGQPCGALGLNGDPVVCWIGETPEGTCVFVRKRAAGQWTAAAALSLPEPPYPWQPRLAADGDCAHVVWTSEAEHGGTGNVFYSRVQWTLE